MRALYFPVKDEVSVGDLPDPVAADAEVVVRVRASGICHTDIEVMRGNYGASAFPLVPGHEFAGEVVDAGAASGLSVGDRVVIDPNLECGVCPACRRGWAHLCERLGAYGVTVNGGFAEYCAVRADRVHPIGDMPFDLAALAEPMGCVLNGLTVTEGRVIDRAAVVGTGPMGLLMGLALKTRGVDEVIMIDLDEDRLAMAEGHGLGAVRVGSEAHEALRQTCDFAVEATGVTAVAQGITDLVANGGAALLFGVCASDDRIGVSPFEVFRRQLAIFGTHSLNHNIPQALDAIRAIGPSIGQVVTHRLAVADIAKVMSGKGPTGTMKVQMTL